MKFSISRISFVFRRLTSFNNLSFFFCLTLSLSRRTTSSILTFSNRSAKLFTLKNSFLIKAKALHSIRMCLAVKVFWQVKHCGRGSYFRMKEWVSLLRSIRNRDITTCCLDFLDAGSTLPRLAEFWRVYCGCFYSIVVAISCEGICLF